MDKNRQDIQNELKQAYLDTKNEIDYLSQKKLSGDIHDAQNQLLEFKKYKLSFKDRVTRWLQQRREKQLFNDRLVAQYKKETGGAPHRFLKPLEYKKWEIVGDLINFKDTQTIRDPRRPVREFINRFGQNFGGIVGIILLLVLIIAAIVIPPFTQDPRHISGEDSYLDFFEKGHIFGTDDIGRDIFAVLFHGLAFSLALAACVTIIEVAVGLIVGILMGQFNWFDKIMTFIIKVISIVPTILILILATIAFNPSFLVMVIALSLFSWTGLANQVRAQVKRAKNFEWVHASRILGTPAWKISWNFIPIILPILITNLIFTIPGVIFSEVSLAFIGQSIPNEPTLGNLLDNAANIFTINFRYLVIPASILIILTVSIQLIGAAIQDSLRRQR
ncbi:Glutathione transport system permease protein gsiD [Mycoplasmopsis californica]|uniref:ABC transporter permease n=1 Tax=Mycoplasmopsis equigenitalium TaxID=114883 RepID=A0ABY5J140_9BACT|nr:ABC transporter permease [Mycoplasmopsis equigenitalium]UUD36972.1 ABC transporter permease [Mycoplasmopsis equigenitalium]VEU69732.1 Glutathione transport system permease protein gsiD [Mycoplasmopsis californica]